MCAHLKLYQLVSKNLVQGFLRTAVQVEGQWYIFVVLARCSGTFDLKLKS